MTGSSDHESHELPGRRVLLLLGTEPERGLSPTEAADRLTTFGPNVLPARRGEGPLRRAARQFDNPLIYVLLVSGCITFALDDRVDSAVIFGVVALNAIIGYIQESRATAALEALRSFMRTDARVVRDGRLATVDAKELVPGDLVLVEGGDRVPADLRLLHHDGLRVDESALTGESVPVDKDEDVLPATTPVADRRNMLYSGTVVTEGRGTAVVVSTGAETELGEIHRLVGSAAELETPLTRKLGQFSRILTVVILALAAATFGVGLARGMEAASTFTAAVALAVGAIPEGLPAAVTITLAIGVGRMARRRAVIRRLPTVETLGSTTVVCSDKTGTLTRNEMTVQVLRTVRDEYTVSGAGYDPAGAITAAAPAGSGIEPADDAALRWTLLVGAGCNDAALTEMDGRWTVRGDPTEIAMLVAAAKFGMNPERLQQEHPRWATVPFSSDRGYMATLHRSPAGAAVVLVKGATERVLALCHGAMGRDGNRVDLDVPAVLRAVDDLASRGLRVLATATAPADSDAPPEAFTPESLQGRLTFTGLQAMFDPPREAAAPAVRACREAGIQVDMITGDHGATAVAIARSLGILDDGTPGRPTDRLLTGTELNELSADDYPEAVERARVFARVTPEQKLRLVDALQRRGHVVAMTGDGVNDAPALRQADVGVAMGRSGTEVAKEASDMVLTDDDFATIEAAVEEGRGVYDNLVKFIVWTLPTNLGEGLVILFAIMLGTALPILPTQILWINMTTAVALGLMLAFEPKEPGIMTRPPRDPRQPLLTRALVERILLVSTVLVAGAWLAFHWEQSQSASLDVARTAAVNFFVLAEAFYLFSCRSLTQPLWKQGLLSNRWIVVGVLVQAAAQAAITYLPAMQSVFRTAPLDAGSWLRITALATLALIVVSADKYLRRRWQQ